MYRLHRCKYVVYGLLPYFSNPNDVEIKTVKDADSNEDENKMDRVKRVFKTDEFGDLSPELSVILNTCCMSMFVGAFYGGIISSRKAYIEFMKNNQATIFSNHLEAKKQLHDSVTLSFGKGAFRWGWRLTVFTTSYITLVTTISAYRGENGIVEHLLAGMITGCIYKFQGGPQATLIGGGLGLVLGTFAGLCTTGLLKLTGMTMNDVKSVQHRLNESRADMKHEAIRKMMQKEDAALIDEHNKNVERQHSNEKPANNL